MLLLIEHSSHVEMRRFIFADRIPILYGGDRDYAAGDGTRRGSVSGPSLNVIEAPVPANVPPLACEYRTGADPCDLRVSTTWRVYVRLELSARVSVTATVVSPEPVTMAGSDSPLTVAKTYVPAIDAEGYVGLELHASAAATTLAISMPGIVFIRMA